MSGLTRGVLAKRCGVNQETLRYYERRGLLANPPRNESNYRIYPEEAVGRVKFIKAAQGLGFTLREVKEMIALRATAEAQCEDVLQRARVKIAEVEEKLQTLKRMWETLTTLTAKCKGPVPISECPIMEALESSAVG